MRRGTIGLLLAGVLALPAVLDAKPQAAGETGAPAVPVALPARGLATAPVEVVEFCDFQSDACGRMAVVLRALAEAFPEQVRIAFRHFARDDQQQSPRVYAAVLAAAQQKKGWEMWDLVFANQDRLSDHDLAAMGEQLGLDPAPIAAAVQGGMAAAASAADREEGARQEIAVVPALVLNGRKLTGVTTLTELRAAVESALKTTR